MATTRTIGPLHFEDLEPKRFEDLVRQLAYEFKPWRKLEATGRAGSDDGFDARGYEMVAKESAERVAPLETAEGEQSRGDDDEALVEGADDRLWLIQCKREKSIGPTALVKYLDDIVLSPEEKLHGLVFTAAADFSKKARDAFAKKCTAMGLEEWHLWGKAELEDRLFQPAADHLLFAYFGVSLTIRRRSQRSDLRAKLVMKRKAKRLLQRYEHQQLVLRPPETPTYPDSSEVRHPVTGEPPWWLREYRGLVHEGLLFCVRRFFAYLHDDGEQWDAAMAYNDVRSSKHDDPWRREDDDFEMRAKIHDIWSAFPKHNQAWFELLGVIPFEDVLDIDELGDEFVERPHIYAPFNGSTGPFKNVWARIETTEGYNARVLYVSVAEEERTSMFPAELRERKPGP